MEALDYRICESKIRKHNFLIAADSRDENFSIQNLTEDFKMQLLRTKKSLILGKNQF